MRRLLPWTLVGLVGLGAGLGAAIGAVGSPGTPVPSAAQWVANVLATTEAAGTAHLDYTEVTTSANPHLRGGASGSGVIDFATGDFRVGGVDHQTDWSTGPGGEFRFSSQTLHEDQIAVGATVYESFGVEGLSVGWAKEPGRRDHSGLGLGPGLGFTDALDALTGPVTVLSVRNLGSAVIDGEAATRYMVRSDVRGACLAGPAAATRPPTQRTTVWIDGQGRLVQARRSDDEGGTLPASELKASPVPAQRPPGSITTINTLHLSRFGEAVHVTAPAAIESGPGSSVVFRLRCRS